jgi:membrane associated rhomboid family serine protease
MGIYDRDYYREEQRSFSVRAPSTMVGWLILINVAVYVADALSPAHWLSDALAVHVGTLSEPWLWWQFLSYGFVHSPVMFQHILFNMFGLWVLGRDVESLYGRKEFLRLYLVLLVVGSVAWAIVGKLQGRPPAALAYGASGAIAGIVVLYAMNFPRRTLLLFFVLPVPAWLCGVLLVLMDMFGATGWGGRPTAGQPQVAYSIHLAGAAFAFLYYQQRWNLGRLVQGGRSWASFWRRPKLRVHDPERPDHDLSQEVDQILEKIHREGEGSLTRKERQVLENASREFQRRRR